MPHHDALRLQELAELLKIGEKTLNVWRHRYSQWIPKPSPEQPECYPQESVDVFRFISKCTHAGMEPQDIETVLRSSANGKGTQESSRPARSDNPSSSELAGLGHMLKDLFSDISRQQHRIADAQERRASAEERKAYALESRAEAELIKANALKDVASFIKDLSIQDSVGSLMEKVKSINAPSPDGQGDFSMGFEVSPEQLEDLPELEEASVLDYAEELPPEVDPGQVETVVDEPQVEEEAVQTARDVDDLSLLLDEDAVDLAGSDAPMDIDDLSLLLEPEDTVAAAPDIQTEIRDIDDLSLLLDGETLGTPSTSQAENAPIDVDDLSRLLDPDDMPVAAAGPSKTAEPAKDKEDYKSKILKRIIHMKQKENLSVEETTRRFNDEGVKTLSGKGTWDEKTIQGIYKYIDSVQTK